MSRILFVCDAGPAIGGGHVMRCLTLAGALTARGAEVAFLETPETAPVLDAFASPEIGRAAPGDGGFDAVLVDHYRLSLVEEAAFGALGGQLVALEDLGRPHPDAALVIDPGALDGPGYQLVRPDFGFLRPAALARRGDEAKRALVSLGLTDVGGITARTVSALLPAAGDIALDVVVGAAAPSFPVLRALAKDGRITLHVETDAMAELIAEADIGVGAGGSSLWERACLGLPSVTLILADNQRDLTMKLDERGATLALDARWPGFETRLATAFGRLVRAAPLRARLSETSAALCDGQGAGRAAERILAIL
ncbi:MAG: UDP-2,4-diacetamido-2,4,6-trideoxy-beta-L-altropyranose hydrolase [Caulobacterales bacterium]|nr:UDP-2,4-diacetamido-2,4,6-trideoxy-beta-L-altropyranose hydrolase [Caulobacterales bacterium]